MLTEVWLNKRYILTHDDIKLLEKSKTFHLKKKKKLQDTVEFFTTNVFFKGDIC